MMTLLLALTLSAMGAEPEVELDPSGTIVGRIVVPADAAEVREVVDDPVACGRLSSDIVSVQSEPAAHSRCVDVTTETKGLFRTLFMRSRRCPTADGWEDRLVQSDDFDAYETRWSLRPVDGGTEVTVRVHTEVDLPVPSSLVQSRQKKSVGEVLENLVYQVLH
jgi:hypothetical protein